MGLIKELFSRAIDGNGIHVDVLLKRPAEDSTTKAFDSSKHPRGQPGNSGQFGSGGGHGASGATKESPRESSQGKEGEHPHIRTPAFKAWFGDWENDPASASKVVDKSGSPQEQHGTAKPVFHGRGGKFDSFDKRSIGENGAHAGAGFYFAEDRRIADTFAALAGDEGNVLEAYLSIKNPYDFDSHPSAEEISKLADAAAKKLSDRFDAAAFKENIDRRTRNGQKLTGSNVWHTLARSCLPPSPSADGIDHDEDLRGSGGEMSVNAVLAAAGYDGLTHKATDSHGSLHAGDEEDFGRVWVAFEPTQIKSTANHGTFDPTNPNMHKAATSKWKAVRDLIFKGFTGTVTAKNGTTYHYVDGKRVAGSHFDSHMASGNPQTKDTSKVSPEHAKDQAAKLINADTLDHDQIAELHDHLAKMDVHDLRGLAKKLGVAIPPNKGALVQSVHAAVSAKHGHTPEHALSGPAMAMHKKLAEPAKLTAADIDALPGELAKLNITELGALKKKLGITGVAAKEEIVAKIHEKMGGEKSGGESSQPKDSKIKESLADSFKQAGINAANFNFSDAHMMQVAEKLLNKRGLVVDGKKIKSIIKEMQAELPQHTNHEIEQATSEWVQKMGGLPEDIDDAYANSIHAQVVKKLKNATKPQVVAALAAIQKGDVDPAPVQNPSAPSKPKINSVQDLKGAVTQAMLATNTGLHELENETDPAWGPVKEHLAKQFENGDKFSHSALKNSLPHEEPNPKKLPKDQKIAAASAELDEAIKDSVKNNGPHPQWGNLTKPIKDKYGLDDIGAVFNHLSKSQGFPAVSAYAEHLHGQHNHEEAGFTGIANNGVEYVNGVAQKKQEEATPPKIGDKITIPTGAHIGVGTIDKPTEATYQGLDNDGDHKLVWTDSNGDKEYGYVTSDLLQKFNVTPGSSTGPQVGGDVANWAHTKPDANNAYTPNAGEHNNAIFKQYDASTPRKSLDSSQYAASFKQHMENAHAKLTTKEISHTKDYTNSLYASLNESMRNCPETLDCLDSASRAKAQNIENAIAKAGTFEKPVTVWRNTGLHVGDIKGDLFMGGFEHGLSSGEPVKIPAFKSCGMSPDVSFGNGNIKLEIRARSGLWVEKNISGHGSSEKELIQGHNVSYRVVSIHKIKDLPKSDFNGDAKHLVVLEEI